MMRPREELLQLIVDGHFPLAPLRRELATYPWDSEPLTTLRTDHVRRILDRFLDGELSATEVQEWAEALEVREDVSYKDINERDLRQLLFDLANPELNGPLTPAAARALCDQLG